MIGTIVKCGAVALGSAVALSVLVAYYRYSHGARV